MSIQKLRVDLELARGRPEGNAALNLGVVSTLEGDRIPVRLKIARCYGLLHKKENSLEIYDEISNVPDPFWSALAREKKEELRFYEELSVKH